jgi:predicted ribosome quality control (RQC) complex YloA/Tae2 family protein
LKLGSTQSNLKLKDVGVSTVSEIRSGFTRINRKLDQFGTMDIFAQVAEKDVSERVCYLTDEIDKLKSKLAFYQTKEEAKQDIEMAENVTAEWTEVLAEEMSLQRLLLMQRKRKSK